MEKCRAKSQVANVEASKARSLWSVVVWLRDWWRICRVNKTCREARRRMNGYTPEQRQELFERALKTIYGKKPTGNDPGQPRET